MAATIKDIAKLANVSHTTVSRALNNSPLIKEDTKRKIMELAEQLNYIPNFNAKSLVLQRSHTIGLFFTSISEGTSSSFLRIPSAELIMSSGWITICLCEELTITPIFRPFTTSVLMVSF